MENNFRYKLNRTMVNFETPNHYISFPIEWQKCIVCENYRKYIFCQHNPVWAITVSILFSTNDYSNFIGILRGLFYASYRFHALLYNSNVWYRF